MLLFAVIMLYQQSTLYGKVSTTFTCIIIACLLVKFISSCHHVHVCLYAMFSSFSVHRTKDFDLKWVDDTHAIGVFSTCLAAQDALMYQHPLLKTRPISQATRASKIKAKKCAGTLHCQCS